MTVTKIRSEVNETSDKGEKSEKKVLAENTCHKCHVRLKDVKLLMQHYWRVHISAKDQQDALNVLKGDVTVRTKDSLALITPSPSHSPSTACSVTTEKSSLNKYVKRLKKSSPVKLSPKNKKSSESILNETIAESDSVSLEVNLDDLSEEEIKYYNLTKSEIDEEKLAERAEKLYSNKPYDKSM